MKFVDEQWAFLLDVAKLINFANEKGYILTGGDLYRSIEQAKFNAEAGTGIVDSLHTRRLAIDLNLFIGGIYVGIDKEDDVEQYRPLGEYWKSLSVLNRWGGDFKKRKDPNHFERNPLRHY